MFYFLYLEDFNINSKIIIFCLIICLLIPLGAVSASDINNTADDQVLSATPSVDTLSASVNLEQDNDTLSVKNNDENMLSAGIDDSGNNNLLKEGEEKYGSLTELNALIQKSNGTLELDKDYKFNDTLDSASFSNGITLSKSITIDGCGKTIYSGEHRIFTIQANHVTLKNLYIKDSTDYTSALISGVGD